MGEFHFKGDFVAAGLENVFTFSVCSIPVGRSRYGFLLNADGGVIDDLIVFRLAEDEAMIVVNAATIAKDFAAIRDARHLSIVFCRFAGCGSARTPPGNAADPRFGTG